MITPFNEKTYEYYALSTDEKPTEGVGNGSVLLEMDTCTVYIFDAQNKQWIKLS